MWKFAVFLTALILIVSLKLVLEAPLMEPKATIAERQCLSAIKKAPKVWFDRLRAGRCGAWRNRSAESNSGQTL
ncbi:hypothetical protein IHQ71_31655 (plasmid) [Rhizobium sp. TH2]|uniref:hypothetical protein n=1 Tax=Rhizobium sp. TH2 TaxID=2775403 RepID=UPI00215755CE|nr:hypothetical protein [Rhizobium sp. TH2]UVC12626.1 hypothetical protein IHQ71_31655 [Rhizobium sp. TH2]